MNPEEGIETYPVGVLRDLLTLRNRLFKRGYPNDKFPYNMGRRWAIKGFMYWFAQSWRKRNYWNGYLAEWSYQPEGVMLARCGKGWTRKRALRNLGHHIVHSNLHVSEARRLAK